MIGDSASVSPVAPPSDRCTGDGIFDFELKGTGFESLNGLRVSATAIEVSFTPNLGDQVRIPFRISSLVAEGRFDLSCASSLRENYGYPAWAFYVDLDRDGRCTDADLGSVNNGYYGWNEAQRPALDGASFTDFQTPSSIQSIHTPLGAFCSRYFP